MNSKILLSILALTISLNTFAAGTVFLNGRKIKDLNEMQSLVEKGLRFPTNSGKDLESFYEALSADLRSENIIRIKHVNALKTKVGEPYIEGFIEAVRQAAENNARVVLVLE